MHTWVRINAEFPNSYSTPHGFVVSSYENFMDSSSSISVIPRIVVIDAQPKTGVFGQLIPTLDGVEDDSAHRTICGYTWIVKP